MTITELQEQSHKTSKENGWHDYDRSVGDEIALCHSELSEALEFYRKHNTANDFTWVNGKPEGFGVELADCIIRLADMAGKYGLNLENCIEVKMNYNKTRSYRHGGKVL